MRNEAMDVSVNEDVGLRCANSIYPAEWRMTTLAEFAEINPKRAIAKGTTAPFVEMAALPTFSRDVTYADVVNRTFTGGGAKFTNGDTLLARITPCLENGKTALVSCLPTSINGHGSTEFIVLAPRSDVDQSFLYYLIRSDDFRSYAISRMEGTSGRQRVPNNAVGQYTFFCPPKNERKVIGKILTALDDRIALLRETNATLEAIAQALFKSWFVDFDPVRAKQQGLEPEGMDAETAALFPDSFEESELGLVPSGWEVVTLGDISKNNSEPFDFSKVDKVVFVNTGDVSNGQFLHKNYSSTEGLPGQAKKAIYENDILFSEIRPKNGRFAYVNFDAKDYVVSTKFMILRAINDTPPRYLYQVLRQTETIEYFNVIAESRSGTFPQITFTSVKNYKLIKPSSVYLNRYIECVNPIFSKIDLLNKQAQTLTTLRDTLLPRLISGQLHLPETVTLAEEAGA